MTNNGKSGSWQGQDGKELYWNLTGPKPQQILVMTLCHVDQQAAQRIIDAIKNELGRADQEEFDLRPPTDQRVEDGGNEDSDFGSVVVILGDESEEECSEVLLLDLAAAPSRESDPNEISSKDDQKPTDEKGVDSRGTGFFGWLFS